MAYHFAAATTDRIVANGPAAWTTKMSIFARWASANGSANTHRGIVFADSFFFDLPGGAGTASDNTVRIGYQDSASGFPLITWATNFITGAIHTIVAVIDTTLGSANLKLYADTDATPKTPNSGTGNSTLSPLVSTTAFAIGGDATTFSFDGNIYEVAYWPTTALTGAQCAALGAGNAAGITLPTDYWPLVDSPTALYGGHNGTVTGATLATHIGPNLYPPRVDVVMAQFQRA
jgi:hypothetical protein